MKRKTNWVKWIVILVLLAAAGTGGVMWWKGWDKDTAIDFKTGTVARGDITQSVTANGMITPVKNVQVGSQISGIMKEVNVDFNDQVKEGQIVARIDSSTYQQNVDQAQAELLNAKAALELAELNYRRAQSLKSNELIAASDADKTLADLHQAEAVVQMREASLKKSRVDLERTTIYAPISGVVITRNVDVGQTVAASFNTPTLFLIANDLAKMEIHTMVSEADVGGILEGQPVTFLVEAYPNRQFQGKVKQVRFAPTTNQNVVTYNTVVEVNNEDLKLRPGMTATVSILTSQKTNVLKLPNSALRYKPPETALAKTQTNAPAAKAAGTNAATSAATGAADPGQEDWRNLSREERRRRIENMTPEQQAAFRERMRARFGEGGPGGGSGGGGGGPGGFARPRSDSAGPRTLYVAVQTNSASGKPITIAKPVTVRLGISDGAFTEVLEGLKEGDTVITGANTPTATMAGPAGSSPLSSPFGRGFRPR